MVSIIEDKLTKKENEIYQAIVFEGCSIQALMEKFNIKRPTVLTHFNSICLKKQIWGVNRLHALTTQFWSNFMNEINWNCSLCRYNTGKCININSQFFNEKFNRKNKAENMVCGQFKFRDQINEVEE